ncbi:hypothetical protein FRC12_002354 [Ceratobasidium sp. 428]|nr:hypothetical protein FRC12_002354 [Ceratobasidium sp. 428]
MGWDKHKRLCKIYQAEKKGEPVPAADSYCGLCGKSGGPLEKTRCCNRTVCDDQHKYQPLSYSRVSCSRNHKRYTRCCYHFNEGHKGDALSCRECNSSHDGERTAWYMTDSYNFLEDIERANPPSFWPTKCIKCGRAILLNIEAHSSGVQGMICSDCMGGTYAGIPGANVRRLDGT